MSSTAFIIFKSDFLEGNVGNSTQLSEAIVSQKYKWFVP